MKRAEHMTFATVLLVLFLAGKVAAETPNDAGVPGPAETPAGPAPEVSVAPAPAKIAEPPPAGGEVSPVLEVSARIDAAYSGGDPAEQGFSLPGLRLSASGEAMPHVGYRLSLGQTREFSTLLLPQVTPVEAYLTLNSRPRKERMAGPHVGLTLGMYAPSLNPWWTPDLSSLAIPDYAMSHRAILPARDLGAELTVTPFPGRMEVVLGSFNGNGIIGANSNSSRAYNAFLRFAIPLRDGFRIMMGAGAYSLDQSSPGSINYKSHWVVDSFVGISLDRVGANLSADLFFGELEDSSRRQRPRGGALMATVPLWGWLKGFGRYESLVDGPTATGTLRRFQAGPMLEPYPFLRLFGLYQTLDLGFGPIETSLLIRARLSI